MMKLTIPRSELKEALAGLTRVVARRASLPVLQQVRVSVQDGKASATATDLEQHLTFQFANPAAEGEGAMLVPLETLRLLEGGPNTEPVSFETAAGGEIVVANTVAGQLIPRRFEGTDVQEWPEAAPSAGVGPVDPAFLTNFRRTARFASTDETRFILNGVCLQPDQDAGDYLVATDGRRVAAFNTIKLPFKETCVVPTTKFLLWTRLAPDELLIGHQAANDVGWFRLVTPRWDYRCRTRSGTYPNWRAVIPGEKGGRAFELSAADADTLRKVLPTFAGHDAFNQPVQFNLCDGKVQIEGRGENDKQAIRLELPETRYSGQPGQISVNREYLLDALGAGFRAFRFEDDLCPLVSQTEDGGIHVVMPLRMGRTPAPAPDAAGQTPAPEPAASGAAAESGTSPADESPAPATTKLTPKKETRHMSKHEQTGTPPEPTALERVQQAYETAKTRVREAQDALALVATAVKDAVREDRARRQEIESVRSGLAKLQAIKV